MTDDLHIYLRVSSDTQQTDGCGLDDQKSLGLKVSEQLGLNPIIHNEGSKSSNSETIDERVVLKDLLLKMDDGEVKNLYVYQMDRLSRNDVVSFQIRQKIKQNGVRLYFGNGQSYKLDNPNDKLMFSIMEGISEFDNSIRTERLRRGKLSKIKKGGWKGGPSPFGYKLSDGKIIPNEDEMKWVKKIYEKYSEGSSIYEIQKFLIRNGVKSRRNKLLWNDNSVKRILLNTHFEGYYYYTDKSLNETVRCEVPKTLPSSLVKKVRDRIKNNKKTSNYIKTPTLLKSYLRCGSCGSKFGQRINKKQYHSDYYCIGTTKKMVNIGLTDEKFCETKNGRVRSVKITDTDELVWNSVVETISESHIFKEQFKSEKMGEKVTFVDSVKDKKVLNRRLKTIETKITQLIETKTSMVVKDIIDEDDVDLQSILKRIEEERQRLDIEKENILDRLSKNEQNRRWYDWVKDFGDKIESLRTEQLTLDEKQKFLDGIIEKIIITTKDKNTHNVEIVFQSPIVNDNLIWNEKGNPKKGYKIVDGHKNMTIQLNSSDKRTQKKRSG